MAKPNCLRTNWLPAAGHRLKLERRMWQVIVTARSSVARSRVMMVCIQMRREQLRRLQHKSVTAADERCRVRGQQSYSYNHNPGWPVPPPPEQHNNGHNWPVGRAAGNLQSTKPLLTSLLSRPRLCQGLQRYRGARSSHNREIDGRTNLLSTPATLTLGLFIFIMFNNYFKLFLFSRNDNNCILDIEITITISIASDA